MEKRNYRVLENQKSFWLDDPPFISKIDVIVSDKILIRDTGLVDQYNNPIFAEEEPFPIGFQKYDKGSVAS